MDADIDHLLKRIDDAINSKDLKGGIAYYNELINYINDPELDMSKRQEIYSKGFEIYNKLAELKGNASGRQQDKSNSPKNTTQPIIQTSAKTSHRLRALLIIILVVSSVSAALLYAHFGLKIYSANPFGNKNDNSTKQIQLPKETETQNTTENTTQNITQNKTMDSSNYNLTVKNATIDNSTNNTGKFTGGGDGGGSGGGSSGIIPTADTTPPTITITTPINNSNVNGKSVYLSATATDNVGVIGVQFLVDGANLGAEDTTIPYSTTWDTTATTDTTHNISARARDMAGNNATYTIKVSVNNSEGTNNDLISAFLVLDMPFDTNSSMVKDYSVYGNNGTNNNATWEQYSEENSGLVLAMPFDNDNSTTAFDYSRYGNNGTLHGVTLNSTDCLIGKCYSFNGVSDYIDAGNASSLKPSTALTISAWIKPIGKGGGGGDYLDIVDKSGSYSTAIRQDGIIIMYLTGVNNWVGGADENLFDGRWHNLAMTYNGVNQTIYIDGRFMRSVNAAGTISPSSGVVKIGDSFKGWMDNVRIYNISLSAAEIKEHYNAVSLYHSSNYNFNGTSNYINVWNSSSLNIGNSPITASAWVYWKSSTESYNSIIEKEISGTGAGYALRLRSDQKIDWELCNATGTCITIDDLGGTVGFNGWHHIVGVYDGSTISTYIDGELDYAESTSLSWGGHEAANLTIGGHSSFGSGRYFNGSITGVQIYNISLNASQVYQVYTGYLGYGDAPNVTYGAINYYVSSSGSDSNDGRSQDTPWKTLGRIFAETAHPGRIVPGVNILLKRGDVWNDHLNLGSYMGDNDKLPITIGAYGNGSKPIIYGDGRELVWNATNYTGVYEAYLDIGSMPYIVYEGNDTMYTLDSYLQTETPFNLSPGYWGNPYGTISQGNVERIWIHTLDNNTPTNIRLFEDADVNIDKGENIIVENLDLREANSAVHVVNSSSVIVRNNDMLNTQDISILFDYNRNCTMESNYGHNAGNTMLYDRFGMDNIMRNNTVNEIHIFISGINASKGFSKDKAGIGLQESVGTIAEYNKLYGGEGGGFDYWYEINSIVRYNYVEDSNGFYPHGINNMVYGNILNGNGTHAAFDGGGGDLLPYQIALGYNVSLGNKIFHNTFYDIGSYGMMAYPGLIVRDNLVFVNTSGGTSQVDYYDNATNMVDSDYNCFFDASAVYTSSPHFVVNVTLYQSFASYQSTGHDPHSVYGNPKLASNFTLNSGSACIDMGANISAMINFPYRDYANVSIPQGSAPDAGAYEYTG